MSIKATEHNNRERNCPVCRYKTLPGDDNSFWICEVCGWEDDGVQADDPDYAGGANGESLNDYRARWLKEHHREGLE